MSSYDEAEDPLEAFYDEVRNLTDKAFHMERQGIDFVNAEDLEVLLKKYNPNPTKDEEDVN